MAQSADLRTRLENALRSNQQRARTEATPKPSVPTTAATNTTPTIKLKTDFRNFAT